MKQVPTEIDGRKYIVTVPDDELYYERGIIVGPPDLGSLELPEELEIRLNHELFARGLITKKDVMRRRQEVTNAWQSALAVDTERIVSEYK